MAANMIDAICDRRALKPFSLGAYDREAFALEVLAFIDRGLAADRARSGLLKTHSHEA